MPDYSGIRGYMAFDVHPLYAGAQVVFSNEFADYIDMSELFEGEDPKDTEIVADPAAVMRQMLIDTIAEFAIGTTGDLDERKARVTPLLGRASIKLHVEGGMQVRRITKPHTEDILNDAKASPNKLFFIQVGLAHLYFNMDDNQNFLNWDADRVQVDTPFAAAPVAGAPAPFDMSNLANVITTAVTAATAASAPAPSLTPTPAVVPPPVTSGIAYTGPTTLYQFNRRNLPSEIHQRVDDNESGLPIIGSDIRAPFIHNGLYYFHDSASKILVCSDGTIFVDREQYDEKMLYKFNVSFADTTHTGVRKAYNLLARHLTDHGVYCHPFYCFRPESSKWGFTCGSTNDDDLPQKFALSLKTWAGVIARYLSNDKVIPKNGIFSDIVKTCNGDGYAALMNIVHGSHPIYHESPSTLIQSFPHMQDNESTLVYWTIFQDYLQLSAYIMDSRQTLDDKNIMDIFINNHKYAKYLTTRSSEERRSTDPNVLRKYTAITIVQTLETFLLSVDSPRNKRSATRSNNSPFRKAGGTALQEVPVRQLGTSHYESVEENKGYVLDADEYTVPASNLKSVYRDDDEDDVTTGVQTDDFELESIDQINVQINQLGKSAQTIRVPDNIRAKNLHSLYTRAIHAISKSPGDAFSGKCVVCQGTHRFVDCTILQNTDFLKEHYIRYCSFLNRELRAREQALGSTNHQLNFVSAASQPRKNDYDGDTDDDQRSYPQDFSRGRR